MQLMDANKYLRVACGSLMVQRGSRNVHVPACNHAALAWSVTGQGIYGALLLTINSMNLIGYGFKLSELRSFGQEDFC